MSGSANLPCEKTGIDLSSLRVEADVSAHTVSLFGHEK